MQGGRRNGTRPPRILERAAQGAPRTREILRTPSAERWLGKRGAEPMQSEGARGNRPYRSRMLMIQEVESGETRSGPGSARGALGRRAAGSLPKGAARRRIPRGRLPPHGDRTRPGSGSTLRAGVGPQLKPLVTSPRLRCTLVLRPSGFWETLLRPSPGGRIGLPSRSLFWDHALLLAVLSGFVSPPQPLNAPDPRRPTPER
jgi:hypothetical protein